MDFIITALPRSGTTWASVWLMDGALCLHDPMANMTLKDLDHYDAQGRKWGVSCTGLWLHPDFIRAQNCPVVLLDRNIEDIRNSMQGIGFAPIEKHFVDQFDLLDFPRFDTDDMLGDEDTAEEIWTLLRPDTPFDAQRWRLLREIKMEPDLNLLRNDPRLLRKTMREAAGGVT